MQFLPFTDTGISTSALGGISLSAGNNRVSGGYGILEKASGSFLASFNKELADAGIKPLSVEEISGPPRGFRTIAPESGKLLNEDDIQNLKTALKKRGLNEDQLSGLDALIAANGQPSIGAIGSALLNSARSASQLGEEENVFLSNALQKLGFSREEAEKLGTSLAGGNALGVMKSIHRQIKSLDEGKAISLDRDELEALLRGMGASAEASSKTMALFGKGNAKSFSAGQLNTLLAPVSQEMNEKDAALQAMTKEFQAALKETLEAKQQREHNQAVSDARGSKRTERAERLMRDDMTAKGNELGPEALARRVREAMSASGEEEGEAADERSDRHAKDAAAKETALSRKEARSGFSGFDEAALEAARTTSRAGLESLITSVGADARLAGTARNFTAATPEAAPLPRYISEDMLGQVQSGLLRQLHDGSRQITLRLDPAELGQLTIMLTVNKGEVKAIFQADNEVAASALSEQMSQLKATLEEQGLKVADLEVQTKLADDPSRQQWAGSDAFNREREMREQARMARLARLRQEAGEGLAQDMHNISKQEKIALTGLHIIA